MDVSIHKFKSHLSEYVRKAQSGQVIELTSHRRVVARVTGVPATLDQGLARLLSSGAATWGGGKPIGAELKLQAGGKSLSTMIMEDRG